MEGQREPAPPIRLIVALTIAGFVALITSIAWAASRDFGAPPSQRDERPATAAVSSVTAKPRRAESFEPVAVAMWDEIHGIVAGHLGACSPSACKGVILRTDDGGHRWSTVFFGPQVFEVITEGTSNAWALTQNSLLVSDNQGGTWTVLDRTGHEVSFPTAAHGWGVDDDIPPAASHLAQPLTRTNNGGQTWRNVPGPCPTQAAKPSAVRFVDRLHGWVGCAGEPSAGGQLKAIYETLDGGASWGLRAITSLHNGPAGAGVLPGDGYLAGMFFDADGHGWMWLQRGCMVATVDGGTTWADTAPDLCTGDTDAVSSGWFLDENRGYVLHRELGLPRPLQLLMTGDGGATWSVVHAWRQNT